MVGRNAFGVLVALGFLAPSSAVAQHYPVFEDSASNSWASQGQYGAYAQEVVPTAYSPYAGGPYGGPGIVPAGADDAAAAQAVPGPFPNGGTPQGDWPYPPYSPNIPMASDCSPWETAYDRWKGTQFCDVLGDAVRESWFRAEYLLWTIDDPGDTLLGAKVLNVANPRLFFNTINGQARVSDLSEIGLRDNSGVRATWGIPLMFGTFELSAFTLAQATDDIIAPELPNQTSFVATSTHINGQISDLLRTYDTFYQATYLSEVWGASANVVLDSTTPPGEGFNHKPIVGLRFLSVRENMTQLGISSDLPDWNTVIQSDTVNNIYGVNLGFESSLVHKWFTIGVRPQVTLGLNSFRNLVSTEDWLSNTEGRVEHELTDTQFTAVGELTLFARFPIREYFNVQVGFTGLAISEVERADQSIVYDTTAVGGVPTAAHFSAKHADESLCVYGLTVGAELIFR